jgi:hypothetical protein
MVRDDRDKHRMEALVGRMVDTTRGRARLGVNLALEADLSKVRVSLVSMFGCCRGFSGNARNNLNKVKLK